MALFKDHIQVNKAKQKCPFEIKLIFHKELKNRK